MLRNLLICGLLAGLCGGLLATGFARVVGEGRSIRRSRSSSSRPTGRATTHEEAPVVSRAVQKSFGLVTAAVVYGLSLGGLFALAFAAVYGRVGRASPARTSILARRLRVRRRLSRAVREVPGEPALGGRSGHDHEAHRRLPGDDPGLAARRRSRRCACAACWPSAGRLGGDAGGRRGVPRRGRGRRARAAVDPRGAGEVPGGDAVPLPRGRRSACRRCSGRPSASSSQATAQRVMTGQPIIPRRRPVALPAASD